MGIHSNSSVDNRDEHGFTNKKTHSGFTTYNNYPYSMGYTWKQWNIKDVNQSFCDYMVRFFPKNMGYIGIWLCHAVSMNGFLFLPSDGHVETILMGQDLHFPPCSSCSIKL